MGSVARRAAILVVAAILAGCGSGASLPSDLIPRIPSNLIPDFGSGSTPVPHTAAPSKGQFAFPFAAGTMVTIASVSPTSAIHAGNFGSVPGGPSGTIKIAGAGSVAASLDLLADAGTPVHPVAAGVVTSAWLLCNVVVVDHGNGTWSEYVHLSVAVKKGKKVTTGSSLGTVLAQHPADWIPPESCGALENGPPHLHLSFAKRTDTAGKSGKYVPLAGIRLCSYLIDAAGNIKGLGTFNGSSFAVPDC